MFGRIPRIKVLDCLIAICVLVAGTLIARRALNITPSAAFGYDESDYMYAANKGLSASYLDRPSVSFIEFAKMGIKYGMERKNFGELSEFIRGRDDITFYRHYHGPIYSYALTAANNLGISSEKLLRQCSWILGLLVGIPLAFAYWQSSLHKAKFTALCLAIFPVFSPTIFLACANLTPHVAFILISMAALGMFSLFLNRKTKFTWVLTCVVCALSLATFEYTPLLVLAIIIGSWVHQTEFKIAFGSKALLKAGGVYLLIQVPVLLCVWAGAVVKLSILKNYLFFAYFTLVRGGAYGATSLFGVWWMRILESPFEWLAGFSALVYLCMHWRRLPHVIHFVIFSLLVFMVTLRNRSPYPQYVVTMIPIFYLLITIALERIKSTVTRKIVFLVLIACTIVNATRFFEKPYQSSGQKMDFLFDASAHLKSVIRGKNIQTLYVQNGFTSTLHYYFPELRQTAFRLNNGHFMDDRLALAVQNENPERIGIVVSAADVSSIVTFLKSAGRASEVLPLNLNSPQIYCVFVDGSTNRLVLAFFNEPSRFHIS